MRNVIVGFAWLSPFALIVLWPHTPFLGFGIVALSHALLLYPTLRPNVQWLGPVITRFAAEGREVWLTIDDGPTDDTPAILALLATRGVRATFFLKGTLVEQRPEFVRAITEAGHTIGNHSHTHPSAIFWCLPPAGISAEIDRCSAVLSVWGRRSRLPVRQDCLTQTYFRAPVGMKNPAVHPALATRGMRLIGWSVRGFDTVTRDPARVAARIVPSVEPGAIIVLHQGRPHSVACLERVIDDLQRAVYSFVIPTDDRLESGRPGRSDRASRPITFLR